MNAREATFNLHLVVVSGGPVDISAYQSDDMVDSIMWAGYPSQAGGEALARLLLGITTPHGRLTQHWYKQQYFDEFGAGAVKSYLDMRMPALDGETPGRGYRYYKSQKHVLYPFGFGLTYGEFQVSCGKAAPAHNKTSAK